MATRAELATTLRRRHDPGDLGRADALLNEATEIAYALQLGQWAHELEARRDGGVAGPDDDRLTPREQAVVGLLATGCTNREIADRLHLSVKTVERHLSNLYRKLGVSNRTEAVTAVLHGTAAAPHVPHSWTAGTRITPG